MKMNPKKSFVLFLLLLIAGGLTALAQGTTGQVSVTVEDPNNARVPNATLQLANLDTGLTRTASTGQDGQFSFSLLPPGRYKLEVSAQGFKKEQVEIVVNIAQTTTVGIGLKVGAIADTSITVFESTPLVQQESSQVGRVVEQTQIRQLPLPTRNFQQLLTLSAGASASVANNTELGRGDAIISVNGQRTTSNSVRINGIDANSVGTNSTPNIAVPATDSLQEFIVQTSLYDASQGRNAGGNVEAITKSGGNQYHGNAYEFLRNDSLNANDFFLNTAGRPRPELSRHQFGGTFGGALIKDKFFFFGSYQGTRERNGASLNNSLTFPLIPAGLRDDNRTATGLANTFGVASATISPVAVAILNAKLPNGQFLIPSAAGAVPSTTTSANIGALSPQSGVSRFRENQFNTNFDLKFSEAHSLSVKEFFATNPTFQANYNFAGLGNGSAQLLGTGGDLQIIQNLTSIAETWVVNAGIVNQARLGISRLRVTSAPEEPFTAQQFGIANPLASKFAGMPTLSLVGAFTLGASPFADQSSRINALTVGDTLSWNVNRHRLRFGGEYRPSQVNFYFNAFSRGQIIFSPSVVAVAGQNISLTSFQNFLTGTGTSIIGSGVFDRALRTSDLNFFAQDDWKITDRLTLNIGLRYDFYAFPKDTRGRLINFDPAQFVQGTATSPAGGPNGFVQPGNAVNKFAGVPTVADTLIPNDKNNFAPRLGFAYRLDHEGRLVVRGGYGVYYDRISTRYANTQLLDFPYLALAVGLVANVPGSTIFRPFSNPFIPVPLPEQFPVNPTIPSPLNSLAPVVGVPISGVFIDPKMRTPYVQQYNLGVQYEVARDLLIDVGYVGNKGTKLLQVITLNQPIYNRTTNAFVAPLGSFLSTQKNASGGMQQVQTSSNSNFNSLQLSVTKRFSKGLQFLGAYTFGKSIDYYSGTAINELVGIAGDQRDWRTNRGVSDFDRTHRVVGSFVYDLPKFIDAANALKFLLNNWQVNGIFIKQSGLPYSIVDAPNNNIIQRANFAVGFSGNPDGSGDPRSRLNNYFNKNAFVLSRGILSAAAVGTVNNPAFDPNAPFGNVGRNLLRGPGQKNIDFSVAKKLSFKERLNAEFRTEFFNLFNWANFANPNANVAVASTLGVITQTSAGPRVIQFAFKFNF